MSRFLRYLISLLVCLGVAFPASASARTHRHHKPKPPTPTLKAAPTLGTPGQNRGVTLTTVGSVLQASNGSWTGAPTTYTYQWQDCNSAASSCANASAPSTSQTYTIKSADVGFYMRVGETASNATGASAVAYSTVTPIVTTSSSGLPVLTTAPTLSGSAVEGSTITLVPGTFSNETTQDGTWEDCPSASSTTCTSITNTGNTWVTISADVGKYVRLEETATNANGNTVVWSNAIGPITASGGTSGFQGTCTTTIGPTTGGGGTYYATAFNAMTSGQTLCLTTGSYGTATSGSMVALNAAGVTMTSAGSNTATISGNQDLNGNNEVLENLNLNEMSEVYTVQADSNPAPCPIPAAEGMVIFGSADILQDDNVYQATTAGTGRQVLIGIDYGGTGSASGDIIRDNNLGPGGGCNQTQHLLYDDNGTGLQVYDNWFFKDHYGYCVQLYTNPGTTLVHSNVFDDCLNAIIDASVVGGNQTYNNVFVNTAQGPFIDQCFTPGGCGTGHGAVDTVNNNAVGPGMTVGGGSTYVTLSGNQVLAANPFVGGADSDNYTLNSTASATAVSGYSLWNGVGPPTPNPGTSTTYGPNTQLHGAEKGIAPKTEALSSTWERAVSSPPEPPGLWKARATYAVFLKHHPLQAQRARIQDGGAPIKVANPNPMVARSTSDNSGLGWWVWVLIVITSLTLVFVILVVALECRYRKVK